MNTMNKRTRTVAASTAALMGSGLVVAAAPAQASAPAEPTGVEAASPVGVQLTRTIAQSPLIVHRAGAVAAKASIAAAPKVVPTKKKSKKKYRSRRS